MNPTDRDPQWERLASVTAYVILSIATVFVLKTLRGIFIPVMLAVFFGYLFATPVEALARLKVPRVATFFALLVVIFAAGFFLSKFIARDIKEFVRVWPSYEGRLIRMIGSFVRENLQLDAAAVVRILRSQRGSKIASVFLSFSANFLGKFSLTLLILVFFYLSHHNYPAIIKRAFEEERAAYILGILDKINDQIVKYVFVKTLISAATGVFTSAVCALFGLKFAIMFGFLAFLLNYIPYVGSFIAVLLPTVFSLLIFPGTILPLFVFGSLLVVQLVWGSFLDPEIMSNRFNMSPIVIILSLVFWGYVWGIAGAFLAVPTTAIIKIILQNIEQFKFVSTLMSKRVD